VEWLPMTITTLAIEELYAQQIKKRTEEEKRLLLKLLCEDLLDSLKPGPDGKYSLLDFEGLGAYDPSGMDAQVYVNGLRKE
jgi:hypothetical protein